MKAPFVFSLVWVLVFFLMPHDLDAQYWPPNKRQSYGAGEGGTSSLNLLFQRIPGQEDDSDSDFVEVPDLDELREVQQSFNIKAGFNRELGNAQQAFGETLGNNLFLSVGLSRRRLTITRLEDFLNSVPAGIDPPARQFAFVQQTRLYYEPELVVSLMEFDRFQTEFSIAYLELFPLTYKFNVDNNLSIGAGVGVSTLLSVQENNESVSNPGDNGYETFEPVGMAKASYYFNSPFHVEVRYVFRQSRYDGNRFPLNTLQFAVGYSFGGADNPIKSPSAQVPPPVLDSSN